jgi:uncharacterized membrane protein
MKSTKKLTVSALFIAIFIAVLGATAGFSFGAVQVRVANALYALSYVYPFLVVPTGLAVVLSNLIFGGLGLPDIIGGFIVATVTTSLMVLIKKLKLPRILVVVPTLVVPALLVPTWLSPMLGIPYWALVVSIGLGHIVPAILGYILVRAVEKMNIL